MKERISILCLAAGLALALRAWVAPEKVPEPSAAPTQRPPDPVQAGAAHAPTPGSPRPPHTPS